MQSIPSINTSHSGTAGGGLISPTNSNMSTTTPSTSPDKLLQLQQADIQTAARITQLQSIISDNTLGVVSRTKAKVELALLTKDNTLRNAQLTELENINQLKLGSKNRSAIEHSQKLALDNEMAMRAHLEKLYNIAMEQREESRRKLEDQRKRSLEAEEELRRCEREAEECMAMVKAAMEKLNEARKRAGKERKLYEEARLIEEGHVAELQRLEKETKGRVEREDKKQSSSGGGGVMDMDMDMDDGDKKQQAMDITTDETTNPVEDRFDKELNAMKADLSGQQEEQKKENKRTDKEKYWAAKCIELSRKVAKLEVSLKDSQATAEHATSKIASLEAHVNESGAKHAYWEEQSAKLSNELQTVKSQRDHQEEQLAELKKKIAIEDNQMAKLKAEIEELKSMKAVLEKRQVEETNVAHKQEDTKLDALTHEIMQLISDKEDALCSVEKVKEVYEQKVAEREEKIQDLQRHVEIYDTELTEARNLLDNKLAHSDHVESSIKQLQAKKAKDEEMLLSDQQRVVEELEAEVERLGEEIVDLEDTNDEQRKTIKKLKKSKKESFIVQDNEIQRLNALMLVEKEAAERLSFDIKHWKTSATDLSKSVCVVEKERDVLKESMDAMQGKLNKQIMTLKMDIKELKRTAAEKERVQYKVAPPQSRDMMSNRFVDSVNGIKSDSPVNMDEDDDRDKEVEAKFAGGSLSKLSRLPDSSSNSKKLASLPEMSSRKKIQAASSSPSNSFRKSGRRRSSEESDTSMGQEMKKSLTNLKNTFKRKNSRDKALPPSSKNEEFTPAKIQMRRRRSTFEEESKPSPDMISSLKLSSPEMRRVTSHNDLKDSLINSLKESTLSQFTVMSDAGEEFDISALEKMLGELVDDRDRLAAENKQLKEGKPLTPSAFKVSSKSPGKSQVYQLSHDGHLYIGKAKHGLKKQVQGHVEDIWKIVQKQASEEDAKMDDDDDKTVGGSPATGDFPTSPFAKHFARHCRNAKSEEEVAQWCKENIKMQVATKKVDEEEKKTEGDGAKPQPTRTVYQLSCSCPDCKSDLHYIGTTHNDLHKQMRKHYNQIHNLVKEEYGEEGFCKDASESGVHLGEFRSSALHFAKHCRDAKSREDVKIWCKANIKVEKWSMVCRVCLSSAHDKEAPERRDSVLAFKSSAKFEE